MMRNFALFGLLGILAACGENRTQADAMEDRVSSVARNDDVWLEKEMQVGGPGWAKMGLIFGYYDNVTACDEWVSAMKSDRPDLTFRCTVIAK